MYKFIVTLENNENVIIERNLESEWEVNRELANMGTNGIIITNINNSKTYHPPHKIFKIEVNVKN